jgi:hypothetical protein
MSFTEPQLFRTNRRHLPAIRDGTGNSTNWSGGVVYLPAGFAVAKFFIVYGQWTVPNPFPAAGDFQLYHCSFWIGIDGSYSSDVLQAGAHCEAQNTSSGIVQREIHPWFEWFPENEIQITNLTVSAGDILSCLISSTSSTTANMILANSTTNRAVAVEMTAPGTNKLDGNCAEWIVERPKVGGINTQLANYGAVTFWEAWGGTNLGGSDAVRNPIEGEALNMTGDDGSVVSKGNVGDRYVTCFFV